MRTVIHKSHGADVVFFLQDDGGAEENGDAPTEAETATPAPEAKIAEAPEPVAEGAAPVETKLEGVPATATVDAKEPETAGKCS